MNTQTARTFGTTRSGEESEHWLSVSDMMAGLMMVFLLISVALMRNAFIERDQIKDVAVTYQEGQVAIHDALIDEFKNDLKKWDARIDRATLSVEFKSPEVLFEAGEADLQSHFEAILNDFFPRYLSVLRRFRKNIEEVRIEGHTSSGWTSAVNPDEAYFNNMWLSQKRTRSVLKYVYELPDVADDRGWVKSKVVAVGFSSSRLVLDQQELEDRKASRRVLFRIITDAEVQIRKILDG